MNKYLLSLCVLALTVSSLAQQATTVDHHAAGVNQEQSAQGTMMVGNGPPQRPAAPRMISTYKEIMQKIALDDANVAVGKPTDGTPIVMQGPFRATMEWRNTSQKSINVHETDAEIFVVLEGTGTIVLGGKLVNPKRAHTFAWEGPTLTSLQVEGATKYPLSKGDVIMIPPGTPHTIRGVDKKLVLWSMHLPMPPGTPASDLTPMPAQPKPAEEKTNPAVPAGFQ